MAYKIIDTHIHIWDLNKAEYPWLKNDTSILKQNYFIEELENDRLAANISEGILVQASGNYEDTDLMLKVAEENDWIKGVVGWLPLMDPDETIKVFNHKYNPNPYFKGVRHQIHDEPNAEWLLQPEVIESLKILAENNLPFDVVGILPAHIETVLKVAEKVPDLKMVFDHINQPPILNKEKFGKWGELIKEAAQHINFYAKISGLGTTSGNFNNWQADDIKPYIEFALQQFGTGRCFCGGDWPVSLLAGGYLKIWDAYKTILSQLLKPEELEDVYYNNAKSFYQL